MAHNEELPDCNFSLGQLAWAQIRNFPYWPCIVTLDAKELLYKKMKNFGRIKSIVVHVQYFGDNCSHEWVLQHNMIPFRGLEDFRKLAENSNHKVRTKNGKIFDPYNPWLAIKSKWDTAIEEASEVLNLTNDERVERFNLAEIGKRDNLEIILDVALQARIISSEVANELADSNVKYTKSKEASMLGERSAMSMDIVHKRRPYNLFHNVMHERTCWKCAKTGDLTRCTGPCSLYFHNSCMKNHEIPPKSNRNTRFSMRDALFYENLMKDKNNAINEIDNKTVQIAETKYSKCKDCRCGTAPACFVCHDRENDKLACSVENCGRKYHAECLRVWPQLRIQGEQFICPRHVCHTCNSINPQKDISTFSNDKLVCCLKCPAAYHTASSCVPAGSELINDSMEIICPRHYELDGPPVKSAWCYLCKRDENLVRCDNCPISFHLQCIEGTKGVVEPHCPLICKYCETGRMPVYGEVVWVKLEKFRWWPARICFLHHEIPKRIYTALHRPGDYCVTFLGTINYHWVHRGQVFLYQDDDARGEVSSKFGETNADQPYTLALKEATEIRQHFETERAAVNKIMANNRRCANNEKLLKDSSVGDKEKNEEPRIARVILNHQKIINGDQEDSNEDQSEDENSEPKIEKNDLRFEEL